MILDSVIKQHLRQLVEGFGPDKMPNHKYYAFDWDDNVMNMPTKIIVEDEIGNEVGMTTEDFAEHRHELGKKPFVYNGKTIVGYSSQPFRNFRTEGDRKFLDDILSAGFGPSWNDFVECINGGSIFAIITARGHNPNTLKKGVHKLIKNNVGGIDSEQMIQSLKDYRDIVGEEIKDDRTLINDYLDMCRYYPVSFGTGAEANPEEGKVIALREFITYVKEMSSIIGGKTYLKNDIKNNFIVPKIGFSDDDELNVEKVKEFLKQEFGLEQPVQTYLTKSNIKKKY